MRLIFSSLLMFVSLISCAQQQQQDYERLPFCEGCEVLLESPQPLDQLNSTDSLPGFEDALEKLHLSGIVYERDGNTPASGVIIYLYHTTEKGLYENSEKEQGMAGRHGRLKGWVRTGTDGRYDIFTMRPAPYPGGDAPAHIHLVVKQPGRVPYYIDDIVFDDDPLLTALQRQRLANRGGSGIVRLEGNGSQRSGKRNIYLLP